MIIYWSLAISFYLMIAMITSRSNSESPNFTWPVDLYKEIKYQYHDFKTHGGRLCERNNCLIHKEEVEL